MVATTFSGVIIFFSGEVVNPIFLITMVIFVKGLQSFFLIRYTLELPVLIK